MGSLVSFCLATAAVIFFLIGTRLLPEFHSSQSRVIVFLLTGRMCYLGHGCLMINVVCGGLVCFQCATLAFGEGPEAKSAREQLLHPQEGQLGKVPFAMRLLASAYLFLHGVATHETFVITLGCFCIYTSVASAVAGDSALAKALVVALCGLATMFLGELAQTYVTPLQGQLAFLGEQMPWSSLAGDLPLDVACLRSVLDDITNLIRPGGIPHVL